MILSRPPSFVNKVTSVDTLTLFIDTDDVTEINLVMHESDIEVSNHKTQWITDRELERELSQVRYK